MSHFVPNDNNMKTPFIENLNEDMDNGPNDCSKESVEDLRKRLNSMKQLMNERNNYAASLLNGEISSSTSSETRNCGVIDDKFLSVIFMFVLCMIITVSTYAFYNLYSAIVKKFAPRHDEL